jgi:tRNA-uridine 2-sulfurtransferase
MFPLAGFTKQEARAVAEKHELPIAHKQESFEICFVTDNDYRRFLKDNVETLSERAPQGDFVLNGEVVGKHDGVPFYTIGQRKGLGLSLPQHPAPLYVTGLDVLNNTVILGDEDDLLAKELTAHSVNLIKYSQLPLDGLRVNVKIRYKDDGAPAYAYPEPDGRMRVVFDEERRAVTPGQSVVLYEGDDLVGGGIIEKHQ